MSPRGLRARIRTHRWTWPVVAIRDAWLTGVKAVVTLGRAAEEASGDWARRLALERGGIARTAALVAGAVSLPIAGLALWLRSPATAALIHGLEDVQLDQVRAAILAALVGTALVTVVAVFFIGRPFFSWAAGAIAFAFLFAVELPGRLGPQLLPYQAVDQRRLVVAVSALIAMGVAAAGLGAGWGRALRAGAQALWRIRLGTRSRRLTVLVPLLLLGTVSVYGLSVSAEVLLNGPWVGVVRGTARGPNAPARTVTFDYYSVAFGAMRQAMVLLPAGYTSSSKRRYPVVYLLHGSPGEVNNWLSLGAAQIEASAHAEGAPAVIMVAANGDGPRGGSQDSWANGYYPGDNMESDLIDSLIPAVDHHFRTLTGRMHTAVAGYSTGGYGAANLALQHPDVFGLSIVQSIDPLVPPPHSFGGSLAQQRANNPLLLAGRPATRTSPAFFVAWGTSDTAAGPSSVRLVGALRSSGYTVTSDPLPGGHGARVWTKALYDALVADGARLTR